MKNLFPTIFLLSVLTSAFAAPENNVRTIPANGWTAWGHDTSVRISVEGSEIIFKRKNGRPGWNTPIYTFPKDPQHPLVTPFTFLKFEYRVPTPRRVDVNLKNETEGNEYAIPFQAVTGGWKTAAVHLNSALYKRGGIAGIQADGMSGDRLAGFQFAFHGAEIRLRNVSLYEADPADPGLVRAKNPEVEAYVKARKAPPYRQFRNGSVFPFGVIHTVRKADRTNAEFFGQTPMERQLENLRLIRLAGFNGYSNFTEAFSETILQRLERLKAFDLVLLETRTCSTGIARLKNDDPFIREIREAARHPNLVAFYGQDEPTDSGLYLRNKKRIEAEAGDGAPVTSAIHMMSVAKELGPAMDVITIDPYSIAAGLSPKNSVNALDNQANLIRNARNYAAGRRVWFIGQGFALRIGGQPTFRFPSPAEIRYEAFNSIAAGADGYFGFIWQGAVPYLLVDSRRGESFDRTLCDPWGNLTDTGKALGESARKIVPVMSFFRDRTLPEQPRKTAVPTDFSLSEWCGEYGTLFIVINRDLFQSQTGTVRIPLKDGEKLYDLDTLRESDGKLSLPPGCGGLLCATDMERFSRLRQLIQTRKKQEQAIREKLLFPEAPELRQAREAFGRMHLRMLGKLNRFDDRPEADSIRDRIKTLSKEYFDAVRTFRKTGQIDPNLKTLATRVDQLEAQ